VTWPCVLATQIVSSVLTNVTANYLEAERSQLYTVSCKAIR
jgi:hypothetical protein